MTTNPRYDIIRRRDSLFRRLVAIADMLSVAIALGISVAVVGGDSLKPAALAAPLVFVLLAKGVGLYDRDEHLLHKTTLDEVPRLFGIATLGTLLVWLADGLILDGTLSRPEVLIMWVVLWSLLVCLRPVARAMGRRLAPPERCLLVGDAEAAQYVAEKLALSHSVDAELVGTIPAGRGNGSADAGTANLRAALASQEIDRVILAAGVGRDELLFTIRELKAFGVKVSVLPEASRVAGSSVEIDHLNGLTLLGMRRFEFTRSSRLIKRSVDLVGSVSALALLSPLLTAVAIAIKATSPGPVLFRQQRIGMHGTPFEMVKFRSMVNEAEQLKADLRDRNEGAAGLFKMANDPRVTRIGRFLRRWQLDELPQLSNVLRGEMSLVGPRPLIPEEDRQIEGWYRRRLDVPPGMTGHWQILGSSSRIPITEMVKLDYLYVANWTLWNDFRILLLTIPQLLRRGGM